MSRSEDKSGDRPGGQSTDRSAGRSAGPSSGDLPRDEHLHAALRHAPDRDAAPGELLSARILAAGRRAADAGVRRTGPARSGWLGGRVAWPWAGAGSLAAALLAATVLFVGRDELPDAAPRRSERSDPAHSESSTTSRPAPAQAATPTPAAPAAAAAPTEVRESAVSSQAQAANDARKLAAAARQGPAPPAPAAFPAPAPGTARGGGAGAPPNVSTQRAAQPPATLATTAPAAASTRAEGSRDQAVRQDRERAEESSLQAASRAGSGNVADAQSADAREIDSRARRQVASAPLRADEVRGAAVGRAAALPSAAAPAPAPAAPPLVGDGSLAALRGNESALRRLARNNAAGTLEWRQADGQRGLVGAQWLGALQAATAPGASGRSAPADAGDEVMLWRGPQQLARLLLRGNELWICEPASGPCEVRLALGADLQTLWQPAARLRR